MDYAAIYYDGITARAHPVTVRIRPKRILIYDSSQRQIAVWAKRKVVRAHPVGPDLPLRLRCTKYRNARLVISDPAAIAVISELFPLLFQNRHSGRRLLHIAVGLALFTTTLVVSVYFTIPRLAKPIAQSFPMDLEERIGRATRTSIVKRWPVCDDPDGNAALLALVTELENSIITPVTMKVAVVHSDIKNAFALPGGYIIVTDSLIELMQGPDELAGVLAHEMGHVVLRHPLEGALSQLGVALILNMISGGGSGELVGIGTMIASISYTRDYEQQADDLALKILLDSSVSTRGYGELFQRLTKIEDDNQDVSLAGFDDLLRTHPYAKERAEKALKMAEETDAPPSLNAQAWQHVRTVCKSLRIIAPRHGTGTNGRVDRPQSRSE